MGGPTREQVPVYCHCASGGTPAEAAANARQCQERGFRTLKTTLPIFYGAGASNSGYSGSHGKIDSRYKETEYLSPRIFSAVRAQIVAMRDAVGGTVDICIDCHGRLSPANAARLAETLTDLDLLFLEEPVPPENVDALTWVTQRSPIPIAAGERIVTIYGARQLLEKQAIAIFQPDIVNCGGLSQAKKMAALAEAHYVPIAPHNPNGPVATVTGVHLAASIPNFLILELVGSVADMSVFAELTDPPPLIENGMLPLPTGPGLGIELKKEAFPRYPYQPFEGTR